MKEERQSYCRDSRGIDIERSVSANNTSVEPATEMIRS